MVMVIDWPRLAQAFDRELRAAYADFDRDLYERCGCVVGAAFDLWTHPRYARQIHECDGCGATWVVDLVTLDGKPIRKGRRL